MEIEGWVAAGSTAVGLFLGAFGKWLLDWTRESRVTEKEHNEQALDVYNEIVQGLREQLKETNAQVKALSEAEATWRAKCAEMSVQIKMLEQEVATLRQIIQDLKVKLKNG